MQCVSLGNDFRLRRAHPCKQVRTPRNGIAKIPKKAHESVSFLMNNE